MAETAPTATEPDTLVQASVMATGQGPNEAAIDTTAFDPMQIVNQFGGTLQRTASELFSYEGLLQLAVMVATSLAAWVAAKPARRALNESLGRDTTKASARAPVHAVLLQLVFPTFWVLALWFCTLSFQEVGAGNELLRVAASLLQAWILIRIFSTFVRDPLWSKTFARVAWTIAALNILHLLTPIVGILDGLAIQLGDARLSLYIVIKGALLLIVLLWTVSFLSGLAQTRLSRSASLTPSVQTLLAQAVRIVLLFIAVMFAMNAVGIDPTALHVFSGAIGVGIGFGLQTIFSNLVAGVIILIERTIKVGDFVELESGVTGEIRDINIRSTRITTNDNVDILVPNAEFINERVTNWTLRDAWRRTRIPFGVAYGTDKELVRTCVLAAAATLPHMLTGPDAKEAQVWLTGFGDSSLDFELVVWLSPAAVKRPSAVAADYNWAIETALSGAGIEIPFPQRDVHIRSVDLPIQLTGAERSAPTPPSPAS